MPMVSLVGDFVSAVTKFYEEEEAFTRRLEEEEQVLELERRRLAELQLADVQRRRAEAEATMAVVAAQNRVLANAGFSADDLGLTSEGIALNPPTADYVCVLKDCIPSMYSYSCVAGCRSVPVSPEQFLWLPA